MQLEGKSAVVYGASNPNGALVARAFAREGATVYLGGRAINPLQLVATEILDAGGSAEVARVDPLDQASVSEHLHQIVIKHGTVDLSFNLAYLGIDGATRLCNLTDEQFLAASFTRVRSNFVTMAAAASEMAYQGRGVILASAAPERGSLEGKTAGQLIGSAAVEALCQQLSLDVGSYGVQVAYLAKAPGSEEEALEQIARTLSTLPATAASTSEIALRGRLSNHASGARVPAGVATG
ncbi:MAG: SDR family oxidoreductase [Thermoplasmata archaeon]|nr:SDR family oxidoreductase [Thermoplasmata archaeon]